MVGSNPTILVAEDDPELRTCMVQAMTGKGYRTIAAADGAEALAYLATGARPDLVLLDLCMPEVDGWQVRQALGKDPALARIPIVVISAAPADRDHLRVSAVVPKPFKLDELLVIVRRHLLDAALADQTA